MRERRFVVGVDEPRRVLIVEGGCWGSGAGD